MIEIVPYQLTWPDEFRSIGAPIRDELGNLALRIDHIGSTSVPGLSAKNIIDIQLTVAGFDPRIAEKLTGLGYLHVERVIADHIPPGGPFQAEEWAKWYFKTRPPVRRINLHVRQAGRRNQRYPLLFRDFLRTHSDSAQAYVRVKTALAHYHADDIDAYCEIKDPVCDIITADAERWAAETHWVPGPTDL
jgi:GrpB-like predicted nucleotidyltransferase (UPF0157 family)